MDFLAVAHIIDSLIYVGNVLASIITSGVNFTSGEIARLGSFVESLLEQSLGDLSAELELRDGDLLAFLADQSGEIADVVTESESRVKNALLTAQLFAQRESERSTAEIIGTLTGVLDDGTGTINRNTDRGVDSILDGLRLNESIIDALGESVLAGIDLANLDLREILDVLGDGVQAVINNQIILDESIFGTVLDTVRDVLKESQEENAGVIKTVINMVGGVIGDVVDSVGEGLGELHPELQRIWQTIFKVGEEGNEIANKANDRTVAGTGGATTSSALEEIQRRTESTVEELRDGLVDFIQKSTIDCAAGNPAEGLAGSVKTGLGFLDTIVLWTLKSLGGLMAVAGFTAAQSRDFVFNWSECHPWNRLPPSETVLSFQRGLLSAEATQRNLQQHGWNAEDAERIVNTGFSVPDLNIAYALWLRDVIDDDAFTQILADLGYPEGMHGPLQQLAFFIPPVQDLITMAVREVFTPEIAEAQGQFEDFPEAFAENAKKQGVSRDWARNYWAAHWSLPSVQMGFEMMHRGAITNEQLQTLMRALDIMPGWRAPLTEISFTPFTRVDIRRMHRLGVLDESEVLRSYKDIGYSEEKAHKQLDFVLAANQEDELVTLDVASDLTRSSILGFYADGIISRTAANLLLLQAGVNVAAAELFLLGADFDIERRERKNQVNLILDRFRFGGRTVVESADEISALGFETRERELALLDLERLAQQETKLPSKADLDKFLKAGIIEPAEYIDQLERQGFSELWANRYLLLIAEGT